MKESNFNHQPSHTGKLGTLESIRKDVALMEEKKKQQLEVERLQIAKEHDIANVSLLKKIGDVWHVGPLTLSEYDEVNTGSDIDDLYKH